MPGCYALCAMDSDKLRATSFSYSLLPAIIACPILSTYLRRHEVGSLSLRALVVGLVAATLTLLAMGISRLIGAYDPSRFRRARLAPIIMAISMALASIGSDWMSTHFG